MIYWIKWQTRAGNVFGGHLSEGIVGATMELVITVIDGTEYAFGKDEIVFIPYCLQHKAEASEAESILVILPYAVSQDFAPFLSTKR